MYCMYNIVHYVEVLSMHEDLCLTKKMQKELNESLRALVYLLEASESILLSISRKITLVTNL